MQNETFCTKLKEHFGRPLKVNEIFGSYDTLKNFLVNSFRFDQSRAKSCLYIYRKRDNWIKMIHYIMQETKESENILISLSKGFLIPFHLCVKQERLSYQ